jgi:hypothetical protein
MIKPSRLKALGYIHTSEPNENKEGQGLHFEARLSIEYSTYF